MKDADYERAFALAEKKAAGKTAFSRHVLFFFFGNVFLFSMDVLYSPHGHWFYWPLSIWAVVLCGHAIKVFAAGGKN